MSPGTGGNCGFICPHLLATIAASRHGFRATLPTGLLLHTAGRAQRSGQRGAEGGGETPPDTLASSLSLHLSYQITGRKEVLPQLLFSLDIQSAGEVVKTSNSGWRTNIRAAAAAAIAPESHALRSHQSFKPAGIAATSLAPTPPSPWLIPSPACRGPAAYFP